MSVRTAAAAASPISSGTAAVIHDDEEEEEFVADVADVIESSMMHDTDTSRNADIDDEHEGTSSTTNRPESYVLLHNVSKKHNVGTLARTCTAFGVSGMVLTGSAHFNVFGSHGSDAHVRFKHYPKLKDAVDELRRHGCEIVGVEIADNAIKVSDRNFSGSTCFMVGNEGHGLSETQIALCDRLMYVPQHGQGTASLNVGVAAAIALHHFAEWASMPEAPRMGAKYVVAEAPKRTYQRGVAPGAEDSAEEKRRARLAAKMRGNDDELDASAKFALFDRNDEE